MAYNQTKTGIADVKVLNEKPVLKRACIPLLSPIQNDSWNNSATVEQKLGKNCNILLV